MECSPSLSTGYQIATMDFRHIQAIQAALTTVSTLDRMDICSLMLLDHQLVTT